MTAPAPSLLIRRADLGGGATVDVRVARGTVVELGPALRAAPGDDVVDARGGALLPGLHDHHLHLLSLAASLRSVRCDRAGTRDQRTFAGALRAAARDMAAGEWVRAVGYHESIAGALDRWALDAIVADRPVRVQHRSGGLWVVNSCGAELLRLAEAQAPGVERDAEGRATGRLWRLDGWLRERLGRQPVDVAAVGRLLASFGITGVTDATPDLDDDAVALLGEAAEDGRLPQRVHLLGASAVPPHTTRLSVGPVKLLLPDHDPPTLGELVDRMAAARRAGRAVAVHCVTRESLVLTLTAIEQVGPMPGDRIEHAAVVPPELTGALLALRLSVVTQPVFLAQRGDEYLADVDPDDRPHLYPYASLLAQGVPVAPSSDAPFGDPDPWLGLAAARDRRAPSGQRLGADERVNTATALHGLLTSLDDPGGRARRIDRGGVADLCLLHVPLSEALREPSADLVRLTLCAGAVVHGRP